MNTAVRTQMADQHVADLLGEAPGARRQLSDQIELRRAGRFDGNRLHRLAELDSAAPLEGAVLIAVVDGEPVAARSLRDGRVIANPFVPTSEAVALLRLWSEDRIDGPQRPRRWRVGRLRVA